MTKILEQLKQAEAQRERIVAERRRLEEEANAALAAQERDELARRAAASERRSDPVAQAKAERSNVQPPPQDRRVLAGVAVIIAVALIAVFWGSRFAPREDAATYRAAAAQFGARGDPLRLKLDRDLGAFAARAREKEKR